MDCQHSLKCDGEFSSSINEVNVMSSLRLSLNLSLFLFADKNKDKTKLSKLDHLPSI